MMMYLPPFLQIAPEIVADMQSLHNQIDLAFPIFLAHVKNMGRPGYKATIFTQGIIIHSVHVSSRLSLIWMRL